MILESDSSIAIRPRVSQLGEQIRDLDFAAKMVVAHTPDRYTNTVDFFDQAMIYSARRVQPRSQIRARVIRIGVTECHVELSTAVVQRGDAVLDISPGERESLVEKALRKLACEPGDSRRAVAVDGKGTPRLRVKFTLSELRRSLTVVGHNFKLSELREALVVLMRCSLVLRVEQPDGKTFRELEGTILQNLVVTGNTADPSDGNTFFTVSFHPAIEGGLLACTFRRIDYEILLKLKSDLARWLYLRISHNYRQAEARALVDPKLRYHLSLKTIIADRGELTSATRQRDVLRAVRSAFEELVAAGLIFPPILVSNVAIKVGRGRKGRADVIFHVAGTQKLIDDIVEANRASRAMHQAKALAATTFEVKVRQSEPLALLC